MIGEMKKSVLTLEDLLREAGAFAKRESQYREALIYGTTDGKAVGTYIEQKFRRHLVDIYDFQEGNSAKGVDFPDLDVDIKTTSIRQPQSSCPFRSARQKIFGLGYSLVLFVYDKLDDPVSRTANLNFLHTIFISAERTADFQITKGLQSIRENEGNRDDIAAFLLEKNLPVEEIELNLIAEEVLKNPPIQGYLTVSNALQWRLQYGRVIQVAGEVDGVQPLT